MKAKAKGKNQGGVQILSCANSAALKAAPNEANSATKSDNRLDSESTDNQIFLKNSSGL